MADRTSPSVIRSQHALACETGFDASGPQRANRVDVGRQLERNAAFKAQMVQRRALQRKKRRKPTLGIAPPFLSDAGKTVHAQVTGMIERIDLSGPVLAAAAVILAATSSPEELAATQGASVAAGGGTPLGTEAEAIAALRTVGNQQLKRVIGGHLTDLELSNEERLYWQGMMRAFGL